MHQMGVGLMATRDLREHSSLWTADPETVFLCSAGAWGGRGVMFVWEFGRHERLHPRHNRRVVRDGVRDALDRSDWVVEFFERKPVKAPGPHCTCATSRVCPTARSHMQLRLDDAFRDHLRRLFRRNVKSDLFLDKLAL